MKVLKKTHHNKAALQSHVLDIKQKGGVYSVDNKTVTYHFPLGGMKTKKYNTKAKRIAFIKQKGNIITFKQPFFWRGDEYRQILVQELEKKKGSVKVIGFGRDTKWYDSMDQLIEEIDWDLMEGWHAEE